MNLARKQKASAPRKRIDLRELPYGLGYLVAAAVMFLIALVAWQVSRGSETPDWWRHYIIPIIYWSSPFLVALAIFFRIRRRRARRSDFEER